MSGVTYNQQTFPRKRNKLDLKSNPNLQIFDTSPTSDKFFNIVDFPEKFTAGKNLFKIKAAAGTLVDQAPVYIEILDYNGDPVYHETLNYAEHDGTRVVSVWVYPDTSPGPAVVYLASRAAYDEETGETYPYSPDIKDLQNGPLIPNLIWSRTVTISPELRNDTEIIFLQQPKVIIEEITQPYLQVANLQGINIASSGSGTVTVRPYGSAGIIVNGGGGAQPGPGTGNQGGGTLGSPPSYVGSQFLQQPLITAENLTGPTSVTAGQIFTVNSVSLLESTGFTLLPEMAGGTITISDPVINITSNAAGSSFVVENSELLPTNNQGFPQLTTTVPTIASGSFKFLVTEVLNSSQAKVAQISGFRDTTLNTNGAFVFPYTQINAQGQNTINSLNRIESSANFTASYFQPPTTVVTEQSQSFAEIKIENLSPATGDVYKVKTLFKAGGLFGDFEDLGDTVLEEFEVLEDADNLETSVINGVIKNRIGFFTSLADFETYWTGSGGNITPDQSVTNVFNPGNIISGVQIKPATTFGDTTNRFAYIHISSSQYHADLKSNTTYKLQFKAHATDNPSSTDTNVGKPRIDIYVSGSSRNSITVADDATRNSAYVLSTTPTQLQNSLQGIFEDANVFGKRIGTVEFNASQSINNAAFNFIANKDDAADIYFVLRRGSWTLADISLVAVNETGFTPNITRINKRIPRTYFDTPLTFRFQFLDYRNNIADMESYVYPVTFRGENTVITGVNNIVSGSLFLNTFPGGGIELHGGSAFIRSVGYQGLTSASAGKGQGFLLYSGSALPDSPDNYTGAGFEVYVTSSAYISARTDTNELIIKADSIEVGSLTATASSIKIKGSSNSYSGSFSGSFEGDGSGLTGIVDTSFETFLNFEAATAFTYIAPFGLTVNFTGSSTSSMDVVGFVTASANTSTFSGQQTLPITLNIFDKLKITPSSSGLFSFSGSRII